MIVLKFQERLVLSLLQQRIDGLTLTAVAALSQLRLPEVQSVLDHLVELELVMTDELPDATTIYLPAELRTSMPAYCMPRALFAAVVDQLAISIEADAVDAIYRDIGLALFSSIVLASRDARDLARLTSLPLQFHLTVLSLMRRHELWWSANLVELEGECCAFVPVVEDVIQALRRVQVEFWAVCWTPGVGEMLAEMHAGLGQLSDGPRKAAADWLM